MWVRRVEKGQMDFSTMESAFELGVGVSRSFETFKGPFFLKLKY
jgi:hypothetical protein